MLGRSRIVCQRCNPFVSRGLKANALKLRRLPTTEADSASVPEIPSQITRCTSQKRTTPFDSLELPPDAASPPRTNEHPGRNTLPRQCENRNRRTGPKTFGRNDRKTGSTRDVESHARRTERPQRASAQRWENCDLRQQRSLSACLGLIMAAWKSIVNDCPAILDCADLAENRAKILLKAASSARSRKTASAAVPAVTFRTSRRRLCEIRLTLVCLGFGPGIHQSIGTRWTRSSDWRSFRSRII